MLTGSVAVVCVVSLAGVGVVAFAGDDDGEHGLEVGESSSSPSVTTTPSTAPVAVASRDAVATPNTGLEDGSVVSVAFARTPDPGLTGQCATEAFVSLTDTEWCDVNVRPRDDATGDTLEFNVVRVIETANGLVDCAERPGRCVIGAYGVDGEPMWAVISFRDDLPPIAATELRVDRTAVDDGDVVSIAGSNFPPGEEVFVAQCTAADFADCDIARSRTVVADGDGGFSIDFIAASQILTYNDDWRACDPCQLRATGFRVSPASVAIAVNAGAEARRPRVEIVEPGPYAYEQRVTLRGYDFQIGAEPTIGWCNVPTSPEEYPNCAYPNEGFGSVPNQSGSFERTDFPLPKADFAGGCLEECMLVWHPGEGSPAAFETRFRMQP